MFVFSLKPLKSKLIILIGAVLAATIACAILARPGKADGGALGQTSAHIDFTAQTTQDILSFISSLGVKVESEPCEIALVTIPESFDAVYEQYNELQREMGLDLKDYAGETVKRWSFAVTNYPGYEDKDCIRINLLVADGRIIGGDICSLELDGFMHSLDMRGNTEGYEEGTT